MKRYACPGCGYVYDEQAGDAREGFAPGTSWSDVPEDMGLPRRRRAEKADFEAVDG